MYQVREQKGDWTFPVSKIFKSFNKAVEFLNNIQKEQNKNYIIIKL